MSKIQTNGTSKPTKASPWVERAVESITKHWIVTCVGIVGLVWVVSGLATGNWTSDDQKNRTCKDVGDSASGYHETMCWDKDTGELVPSN
jgi:hypothetical protein